MRTWLLEASAEHIVVAHQSSPSQPLDAFGERVLERGYWAVWFLFKDQPYDVGRFYRPDGTLTGFYADVLKPVRWTGADPTTLEPIVDLFLDLWVAPDGRYLVLDEEEFAEAIARQRISGTEAAHARRVLGDLIEATARGMFPPTAVKHFRLEDSPA